MMQNFASKPKIICRMTTEAVMIIGFLCLPIKSFICFRLRSDLKIVGSIIVRTELTIFNNSRRSVHSKSFAFLTLTVSLSASAMREESKLLLPDTPSVSVKAENVCRQSSDRIYR